MLEYQVDIALPDHKGRRLVTYYMLADKNVDQQQKEDQVALQPRTQGLQLHGMASFGTC